MESENHINSTGVSNVNATNVVIDNKPWLWKKGGPSPNPGGKPKGTISLKTYVKNRLLNMTDEEKEEFLDSLPKQAIWQMAEGNPETKADVKITDKSLQNASLEELELAKQLLEQRQRSTTTNIESKGTDTELVGGETSNQE